MIITFFNYIIRIYPILFNLECYCKIENGDPENNDIICKVGKTFHPAGSCDSDEWCTGPANPESATTKKELCRKGRNTIINLKYTIGDILHHV